MAGAVDSLNVAVAAGILLHHLLWLAPIQRENNAPPSAI